MKVVKRNKKKEDFNIEKIINALNKANDSLKTVYKISSQDILDVATCIEAFVLELSQKSISVEKLQDIVEEELIKRDLYPLARNYIRYRHLHELERDNYKDFMQSISDKLEAKNVKNQNANVDEKSFGGRIGEASSLMTRKFALDYCMSEMARDNHLNNEIYIHDLDFYAIGNHNCLSIPFDHLLENGFNTRQTDVRPANSINTAFQLIAVIFQLQSLQQFGGVSATHLDWTMVPYVKKSFYKHMEVAMNYLYKGDTRPVFNSTMSIDSEEYKSVGEDIYRYAMDMTQKELTQAVEGMYHNLNTLQSRSGNQLPFTSINYGTCTLPEGRMVTKALLKGSINGVGKHQKTSIFPCGIFQYMKGVNDKPGTPNYDLFKLALESTSKRLYPNYCNVDWSNNVGYDINDPKTYNATMGCRTVNGIDINAEPGTNPQTKDGRGNICPVTIILPTLAMEAGKDIDCFMELLDKKIHEAKDMLIERFEYMCKQSPESAKFMYENGLMLGYKPEEGIRSALKHGTLVIGQLGLAETLELLVGCNHTKPEGMQLAHRIEKLFNTRCAEFKQEWHFINGKPTDNAITKKMIQLAKQQLGRELTDDELNQINIFKK